jgi:hypothetical protein
MSDLSSLWHTAGFLFRQIVLASGVAFDLVAWVIH